MNIEEFKAIAEERGFKGCSELSEEDIFSYLKIRNYKDEDLIELIGPEELVYQLDAGKIVYLADSEDLIDLTDTYDLMDLIDKGDLARLFNDEDLNDFINGYGDLEDLKIHPDDLIDLIDTESLI